MEEPRILTRGWDGSGYWAVRTRDDAFVVEVEQGSRAQRVIAEARRLVGGAAALDDPAFTAGAVGADGRLYFTLAELRGPKPTRTWLVAFDPRTSEPQRLAAPTPALARLPNARAARAAAPSPAERSIGVALEILDRTEGELPRFTEVADVIAERHLRGGMIDFLGAGVVVPELSGRSGGIMHAGFHAPRDKQSEAEKAFDAYIVSFERPPGGDLLEKMRGAKARGAYLIGLGRRGRAEWAEHAALCDAWFDIGVPEDTEVRLPNGTGAGRADVLANAVHGWVLTAEIVGALTRRGKMPTMWMSYGLPEGHHWGDKYNRKTLFHEDVTVPPQPPGALGRETLRAARYHVRSFARTQVPAVRRAAEIIAQEARAGRKTVVALTGHMPQEYVGFFEDAAWAHNRELHIFVPHQVEGWRKETPRGALVLILGYTGVQTEQRDLHRAMGQRTIVITGDDPNPDHRAYDDALVFIDDRVAWGDATVRVEGYPIRIVAGTGYMQLVAYDTVNAEVLARLADKPATQPAVLAPGAGATTAPGK